MPQMSPINWLFLSSLMILMILLVPTLLFHQPNNPSSCYKTTKNKFHWMW